MNHSRKTPPKRTKRIASRSNRQRRRGAEWNRVTAIRISEVHGLCQVSQESFPHECTGELIGHHILPRGQGGANTPENNLPVCINGHSEIHAHPERSYQLGLMRRSWEVAA